MSSRSVAFAVLITVALFPLYAFSVEGEVSPLLVTTNPPPPKTAVATRFPTSPTSRIITPTPPTTADLVIQPLEPIRVVPGGTTAYTLTIRNQGPAQATGIVLTHVLAKGVVPVWTEPSQPWCDRQDRSVRCAIGEVRPSDTTTITLDLSVGGTQTHVANTQLAGVTLDLSMPICAIDMSQSSVTCRLTKLAAGADARIRIGARADVQVTGALVNRATVTANETDPNPSNNARNFTMTVGRAAPVTVTPAPATTDLVMQANGPSSAIAGQPFTYTYTITNRGELDATGVHFEDALPPTANLYGYTPGLPACEQRGDILTCSLHDPDSGETVRLTLAITGTAGLPVRITPDQLMPGWPICTVLKERTWLHIVKCELGTLKRGQTTHVQLGLVAIGLLEHPLSNTAVVSAREADLNPRNNTITTTMAVRVRADLSVRSAVSGPAIAGQPLSYTLTVANKGPSDADGVLLTDTLPLNTRFLSAVPSQGDNCRLEPKEATAGAVVCRLGPVSRGGSATVTIALAVDEPLSPASSKTLIHSAKVASEQADPDSRNNAFTESIPIRVGAKQ